MQQSKSITLTQMGGIQSQLQHLTEYHDRLTKGTAISYDEMLSIPTLHEIKAAIHKLAKGSRGAYKIEEYAGRDQALQAYVVGRLMENLSIDTSDAGERYQHLITMLVRYGHDPKRYLPAAVKSDETTELSERLCRGADAFLKGTLHYEFQSCALYPDDADLLLANKGNDNERLQALLRPLDNKLTVKWLTAAEAAYEAAGLDMLGESGFVDRIMPDNIFNQEFREAHDPKAEALTRQIRRDVGDPLFQAMKAATVQARAKIYEEVIAGLKKHHLTARKFVDMYPSEKSRKSLEDCFHECVIAYVKMGLVQTLKNHPLSDEDHDLINNDRADPVDQLNALFKDSGKVGHDLLTRLEEGLFELHDPALAQRILSATDKALQPEPALSQR